MAINPINLFKGEWSESAQRVLAERYLMKKNGQVIETPDDAKVVEQQKQANFLSDKNALARNPETNPNLDIGEPFARGIFDSHDLPANMGIQGQQQQVPYRIFIFKIFFCYLLSDDDGVSVF